MATTPLRYRLKYVGGPTISSVRYLHVKDGTNDRFFYDETVAEVEAIVFESDGNVQDIVIESVPLFVVQVVTNPDITSVTGHLSTHRDNWIDWKSKFSFGDYYGSSPIFNVRLGGQFHVRDGNFHTLNGIYKGFRNVKSWNRDMFKDYIGGTDGDAPIVATVSTFEDNSAVTFVDQGLLRFFPYLESVRRCWANNTSLSTAGDTLFAHSAYLRDYTEAFLNCPIAPLSSRFVPLT